MHAHAKHGFKNQHANGGASHKINQIGEHDKFYQIFSSKRISGYKILNC